MDPLHRAVLRKFRVQSSDQSLVSDSIVPFSFQEEVSTEAQVEQVEAQPTNRQKNSKLSDLLPNRGPRAFSAFSEASHDFRWIRDQSSSESQNTGRTGSAGENTDRTGSAEESTGRTGSAGENTGRTGSAGENTGRTGSPGENTGRTGSPGVSAGSARLPDSVSQRVPSDRESSRSSARLGAEWEAVSLDSGVSTEAVYRCRSDHSSSAASAASAGSVSWRRAHGRKATSGRSSGSSEASDVHPSVSEDVVSGGDRAGTRTGAQV